MIDYDKIATEYAANRKVHPGVLEGLIAKSGAGNKSKVVEVGCGTGNYIIALEAATAGTCFGIDPSEEMLERAGSRTDKIEFHCSGAGDLAFDDDFFDLVFSVDVIHHVQDRFGFFRENLRVLKPGGTLCTVTDSEWIIKNRLLAKYFPETIDADLARYPRIWELNKIMEQAGFNDINEEAVEFTFELDDIRPYQDKAFSCLHLISEDAFNKGIERMETDLREGPIKNVSRYLLLWGMKNI